MLSVVSARLPSGEAPTAGVPLVPYVLVRRGDAPGALSGDDVPEEGTPAAGDARFALRFRWYRSVLHRGSALCWVHPDREATIQVRGEGRRRGKAQWARSRQWVWGGAPPHQKPPAAPCRLPRPSYGPYA
jgi:hypothetical protein